MSAGTSPPAFACRLIVGAFLLSSAAASSPPSPSPSPEPEQDFCSSRPAAPASIASPSYCDPWHVYDNGSSTMVEYIYKGHVEAMSSECHHGGQPTYALNAGMQARMHTACTVCLPCVHSQQQEIGALYQHLPPLLVHPPHSQAYQDGRHAQNHGKGSQEHRSCVVAVICPRIPCPRVLHTA